MHATKYSVNITNKYEITVCNMYIKNKWYTLMIYNIDTN